MSTVNPDRPSPHPRRRTASRRQVPPEPARRWDLLREVVRQPAVFQRVVILILLVIIVIAMMAVVFLARAPEIVSLVTAARGQA